MEKELFVLDKLKNVRQLDYQLYDESKRRARNQYKRDYTRILYSSSFRRLQGKMQLLGVDSDQFYRNRLTHSLEVAQIARAIADNNNYSKEELYVVETGALAHDIGNPPFGHHGESVLNSLCKFCDGFEGNAQTFRVISNLEKKNPNVRGLNLSLRTLLSVVKYYKKYDATSKKFLYLNDYDMLYEKINDEGINLRTIDVQIVDLADEIAYAAHDLEDTLSQSIFTIDELLHEFKINGEETDEFKLIFETFEDIIHKAKNFASEGAQYNSSEEFSFLFTKEITSALVNLFIEDIDIVEISDKEKLKTGSMSSFELGFKKYGLLVSLLKNLTFKAINRKPHIQMYEKMGEKVIKGLYNVYMDKEFNKNCCLLPVEYRPKNFENDILRERCVIDYISGMMDSYSIHKYESFFGKFESKGLYKGFTSVNTTISDIPFGDEHK